jgi:hypothetical protein
MTTLAAVGALLLAVLATAPRANAATIYACYKKRGGTIRIVAAKSRCHHGEVKLAWNSEGAAGRNGSNGRNGKNGVNGSASRSARPAA